MVKYHEMLRSDQFGDFLFKQCSLSGFSHIELVTFASWSLQSNVGFIGRSKFFKVVHGGSSPTTITRGKEHCTKIGIDYKIRIIWYTLLS